MALIQPIFNSEDQHRNAANSIRQFLTNVLVRDSMLACFIEFGQEHSKNN
jgi:hypothetical protein